MDLMTNNPKNLESALSIGNTVDDDASVDSNGIDRISELPNEILCHILGFLPTKDAIATSVLSTRWRHLFPLIPELRLDLYDTLMRSPRSTSIVYLINFANFMDRLLNVTLCDVPSIFSVSLSFKVISNGRRIADWVGAALRLNVENLELRVCILMKPRCLVDKLHGCNLISLILSLEAIQETSYYNFFLPNLHMLFVEKTKFAIFNNLLMGCPMLEALALFGCFGKTEESLCIKIPMLNTLIMFSGLPNLWGAFELDCPLLEDFTYCGFLDNHYLLNKLGLLKVAHLDMHPNVSQFSFQAEELAIEILNACCYCQYLWVSELFINALDRLPSLPTFPFLVLLSIEKADVQLISIFNLIECAPNLRTVIVEQGLEIIFSGMDIVWEDSIEISCCQRPDGAFVLMIQR